MSAPIRISLSVKIRRFSNIHSCTRIEPSAWVASATAIEVRSAGNAGHGPSWILLLYSPTSACTTSRWPPGTSTSLPCSSVRRPRRSKTRRIMRRSPGTVSLMRSSPPVTPASAMKLPISMWSGATSCSQPCRRSAPLTVSRFEPIPWMSAPIFTSIRARSCTWGSQAALPITVCPGVSAAAISAFSVAITEGSSMNTSLGRRPAGRSARSRARTRASRPSRGTRPGADPGAGGRSRRRPAAASRRAGSAPAAARRAGTTRGSARRAPASTSTLCTPAAHSDTSCGPRQLTRTPSRSQDRDHRLDVADARHVAHERPHPR